MAPRSPSAAVTASAVPSDPYIEYATWTGPSFDANSHAHASLSSSSSSSDLSSALAKLNFSIEDLSKQLKDEVKKHHQVLLAHAAGLGGVEGGLRDVRAGLAEVESGVSRLQRKIATPYASLDSSLTLLTRLRRATQLTRRASRFTVLARRLEGQMGELEGTTGAESDGRERRERALGEAALTLAEIEMLLKEAPKPPARRPRSPSTGKVVVNGNGKASSQGESTSDEEDEDEDDDDDDETPLPIRSLRAVAAHIPQVERSRQRVEEEMESTLQRGLEGLDPSLLASSLQTAHNLSVLPQVVQNVVADITDAVGQSIRACFDMSSLAREVGGKDTTPAGAFGYKSRMRSEPTNVTLPLWTSIFWGRLENLMGVLVASCNKLTLMERVLKAKRIVTAGGERFFDEAMTVLDASPSLTFWTSTSSVLEERTKDVARSSAFVQSVMGTSYPRALRLLMEFFERVGVGAEGALGSPETILVLRSVAPFESLYLTRCSSRLNELVSSSFSLSSSRSAGSVAPGVNEALSVARAVVNELDKARFEKGLVASVAREMSRGVEAYVARSRGLIVTDHSATTLLGPLATPSQHVNADLASGLYHLWSPLSRAILEHGDGVKESLGPSIDGARLACVSIGNALIAAMRRESSAIIARMHRIDYSTAAGSAGSGEGGASPYMGELTGKLAFLRDEVFRTFRVGELGRQWALDISRYIIQTFVLHASIVRPLGEAGKLKLTSDTTSLEFGISQFLARWDTTMGDLGDQFKALRSFRPLLFLDDRQLGDVKSTADVPAVILLQHTLSRVKGIEMPHQIHSWTEGEYVRWLNEHEEKDRMKIVASAGLKKVKAGGGDDADDVALLTTFQGILRRHGYTIPVSSSTTPDER